MKKPTLREVVEGSPSADEAIKKVIEDSCRDQIELLEKVKNKEVK